MGKINRLDGTFCRLVKSKRYFRLSKVRFSSVKYEFPNKAGYFPEVFLLLKDLDKQQVYSHDGQLSHPADIFLLTFTDAIDCITRLAKSVNDATECVSSGKSIDSQSLTKIRNQIFDLLFYTANFVEGCQSIIRSIFPPGDKQLAKVARDFKGNVEDYTSHALQLINKVKHQHRRPRTFSFNFDNRIILGYYLEGLVDEGVLGPDPELHKPYKGVKTGFSLNRIIPYHLCSIYYVSACLGAIVKKHGKLGDPSENYVNDDYVHNAFLEVEKIPCLLFPDEFEKPLPTVTRRSNGRYLLEIPGKKKILNNKNQSVKVNLETRVGVWDRGIAPPYMIISK